MVNIWLLYGIIMGYSNNSGWWWLADSDSDGNIMVIYGNPSIHIFSGWWWLEPWNFIPNWRSPSFFRGVGQPPTRIFQEFLTGKSWEFQGNFHGKNIEFFFQIYMGSNDYLMGFLMMMWISAEGSHHFKRVFHRDGGFNKIYPLVM